MARPLRIQFPGAVYHVTSRGNARQRIYLDDQDRRRFLAILSHVVDRYDWLCHAYCLMDNHYHLILETPKPNLALGMRQLNGMVTQAYNRRHRKVGHLFQGRYHAILLEKESYLLELCRYVVLNPVRAKAVRDPGQWRWSSYRATAGAAEPAAALTVDWILGQFASKRKQAQARYRRFVAEGSGSPWEQLRGQIYLGRDGFVEDHQPGELIREVPRRQTQARRPSLGELFGKKQDAPAAIVVAYRQWGYRMHEIAEHIGKHYATVSRHLRRAEARDA